MDSPFSLAVSALVVVAIAIAGTYLLGRAPAPAPDVGSESPSPVSTPVGMRSALDFDRPFDYVIPARRGLVLVDASAGVYIFEVGGNTGNDQAIAVRLVRSGHINPCSPSEGTRQLAVGPGAIIEYLRSIPGLDVSEATETTVDGRAALSVDVVANPEVGCPEISLWPDAPLPFTTMVPPGHTTRMIATDVDGANVVVVIVAEDLAAWLPTATEFVESLDFH
jgi:hypothetical protein